MGNLAALILRLVQGSLMAGHGAQKLFGSFGGHGLEGTSGFMEMLGLRLGRPWGFRRGSPSSEAACSRPSVCSTRLARSAP
jgi:putative oxidoreductase